ncbi:hypothetical protein BOW51_01970 [Solemya velesiana gill symbiont]|uniref:Response regulatory domain-containing protein n=2 Tax=Solemya velesiana gill symbiont TaxID=1918948 RepID=A0A1T2KXN0_9GAMM|nr:hypothetical protein BOW51_01970 [Solemya velesiana gill symbiont]
MGYEVTLSESCEEALAYSHGIRFDLALLDYNLPDGLGTELMTELQRMQPHLKIIISSADPSVERISNNLGALAFIRKPAGARTLNSRFIRALNPRAC